MRGYKAFSSFKANFNFFVMKYVVSFFCWLLVQPLVAQSLEVEGHTISQENPYIEIFFEGKCPKKGYKTKLILTNTADAPLFIKKIEGGCSCIKTRIKKKKLKQHETTILSIQWKPPGETEFSGAISIQSNDFTHPELWIHLMGNFEDGKEKVKS